jgi:DNA polymerase I-like protein with 3'-5' exonuclease and polymerase domains
MLAARIRRLEEWLKHYNESTGRIHGKFVSLGTWTHRMSHQKPNMGNVSAEKSIKYKGKELYDEALRLGGLMRSFWVCPPRSLLVGTDADAIHLRIFAHLISDKELIDAIENGDKNAGTDPHSLNQRKIGALCTSRDLSKTCLYSFFNGAGAPKFADILGCSIAEGKKALDGFYAGYPGLEALRYETIPILARQGYFEGLDGRKVPCDSEHHMLACMLQNYEKVIMTHANILWRQELRRLRIAFKQVNSVHDEWQTEIPGCRATAGAVGLIQSRSLRATGERFGLRCPIRGNYNVGKDWHETH